MSIMVAIQSCIYYYAACSPCNKCLNRRKRRQEAVREKKLKAEIEDQQPGLYRHPSPFSTNIYWQEEMLLGPGPPHRKKRDNNRTNSQRTLTTGDQGSSVASSGIGSADGPASDMEQEHRLTDGTEDGIREKMRSFGAMKRCRPQISFVALSYGQAHLLD